MGKVWLQTHGGISQLYKMPSHNNSLSLVVVVLITNGMPETVCLSLALCYYATPSIDTYLDMLMILDLVMAVQNGSGSVALSCSH